MSSMIKNRSSISGNTRTGLMLLAGLIFIGSISGCASTDSGELDAYIQKVLARKSKKIEPLPEIKVPEVYTYQSSSKPDPFLAFVQEEPEVIQDLQGNKPDTDRVREELEYFPLDALRMVGTLETQDQNWALITDPDGAVHRIQVGNYMGKNYGKVLLVAEDHIELLEIIRSSRGWEERPARLDLAE